MFVKSILILYHKSMSERLHPGELLHCAKVLKETRLFTRTDLWPLYYKQLIFLTLAGEKPLSIVESGRLAGTGKNRWWIPDSPAAVSSLLDSLGLVSSLWTEDHSTMALVATQQESITAYITSDIDPVVLGRLFGYPETAVQAYAEGSFISLAHQRQIEKQAHASQSTTFRFSVAHWQEELEVVKRRHALLAQYSLVDSC